MVNSIKSTDFFLDERTTLTVLLNSHDVLILFIFRYAVKLQSEKYILTYESITLFFNDTDFFYYVHVVDFIVDIGCYVLRLRLRQKKDKVVVICIKLSVLW